METNILVMKDNLQKLMNLRYKLIKFLVLNVNYIFLGILINKLNWIADTLMKSISMHHNMADEFKNDEKSMQLVCN